MAEINRENKDRLFRFIFGREENKAWTLSLYNALNGSSYTNPDDITINTVNDVLYMDMKNDISFLIGDVLNLYEQQATFNPNMPARFLIYAGMVYSSYIENEVNHINLYSSRQQMLPVPKLICFYNGVQNKDDAMDFYLSSAFPEGAEADISVKVRMLNINYGHNMDLLNACQPLHDYAYLIARIRFYQESGLDIEEAVDKAVDDLQDDSVIKAFILSNKAEVKRMCITEYDEVKTMNMFREEGRSEGREQSEISSIRNLMETMKWTAQQAMDVLKISTDDRQRYLAML